MTPQPSKLSPSPEATLRTFLASFEPKHQRLVRSIRTALRKRFPTANELAYDYTTHVVLAYAPSTRGIEAIVALDARPDGVRLYFHGGPRLPDPKKLLQGTGKQVRFIPLESVRQLSHPDIDALLCAATAMAAVPLTTGKGKLFIQSPATSRSPRRTSKK